jgi:hypothetical protein
MTDLGEAHSKKTISLCAKYGIVRHATAGYTPDHNAFVERVLLHGLGNVAMSTGTVLYGRGVMGRLQKPCNFPS